MGMSEALYANLSPKRHTALYDNEKKVRQFGRICFEAFRPKVPGPPQRAATQKVSRGDRPCWALETMLPNGDNGNLLSMRNPQENGRAQEGSVMRGP